MAIVRAKGQVTIPAEIRERAHVREGDPVEFEVTPDGILMRPQKIIDATQAWFWTPAWQAGEAEAEADIRAGRVDVFKAEEEFLDSLD